MLHADQIWHNASILTMDSHNAWAGALAVKDGKVLAVGRGSDVLNLAGPGTIRHDMHGRFIMPGLVDSHTHALWGACRDLFDVYVGYAAGFGDLLEATAARARQLPAGTPINGGPWRPTMRSEMGDNPKALLDHISTAHPIVLADTSQHILWCNSIALDLAGITRETDIPGGVIERLSSGEPNGILAENAGAPVWQLLGRTTRQLEQASKEFVQRFNAYGITAFKEPEAFETDLQAYQAADQRGELTVHMAAHIVRQSPMSVDPVAYDTMEYLRHTYASQNVRTSFAKLFLDGVAPGHTASFLDPYLASSGYDTSAHHPDATLLMAPELLNETVCELDARGFTVKMHAVGDNALRKGLDAIEAARKANGPSGLRHETAHSVFLTDDDLSRYRALDAVAEVSPKLWFPNAATPAQIAVLGEERLQKAYRIADLKRAGAEMTYGSDWPAAAPDANPWAGLAGMLTRRNSDPRYPGVLAPDQAIELADALPIFTRNGARSLGMETETGSLTAGKWADFIVLDAPLTDMAQDEIGHVEVRETIWKGQRVFSR